MLIKEKIEALQNVIKRKVTYEELAPILGLNSGSALRNWEYRKRELADFEIDKIDEAFGIKQNTTKQFNIEQTISIDYYPDVFGSCGGGAFVLSERKEKIQVPVKLFKHFSTVKKYSVINAIGDSMSPSIKDRDRLIVEHWEGGQIKDNKVYVFCYKDEIFVKRLVKNIDEIIVQSDNPDPMYRPRFIEKDDMNDVLIVGEIVGLMREF